MFPFTFWHVKKKNKNKQNKTSNHHDSPLKVSDMRVCTWKFHFFANSLEQTIQQIMDTDEGSWDKGIVIRVLQTAHHNPERAIDCLYLGIPEEAQVVVQGDSFPNRLRN